MMDIFYAVALHPRRAGNPTGVFAVQGRSTPQG